MADPAVVQTTPITATSVTSVAPSLTGVAAGNLLIITLGFQEGSGGNASAPTISDSNGDTWAAAFQGGTTAGTRSTAGYILYAANVSAGTHTVTLSSNGGKTWTAVEGALVEFSNIQATPLDTVQHTVQSSAGASSVVSGTIATTQRDLVIVSGSLSAQVGLGVTNASMTDPPSGFTSLHIQNNTQTNIGYESAFEVGDAGNYSCTWTWPGETNSLIEIGVIASFKATVSSSASLSWITA